MRAAVIVTSVGERPWFPIALKWLEFYCARQDYDLIVCHQPAWPANDLPKFDRFQNFGRIQKLGIGAYFEIYDRIIQLDDTCLVAPDTARLTDLVPDGVLGCVVEGEHVAGLDAYLEFHRQIYARTEPVSATRFMNAGVCVFSRAHAALFDKAKIDWSALAADPFFPVQGHFLHHTAALDIPLLDLGSDFNFLGSAIRRCGGPLKAPASVKIFHLTSALSDQERRVCARAIDRIFTLRLASSPSRTSAGRPS